jgi:cysteinyl-tRNA synthetase
MEDDLNTAESMGALFELVYLINTDVNDKSSKKLVDTALDTLLKLSDVLGLLMKKADDSLPEDIQKLVDERKQARLDKNWALSDSLRDQINEKGYLVEDTKTGQKVTKA